VGESTRWPAWSRLRSARSPHPGLTGSQRSGSRSGGPARQTWARLRVQWDPLVGRYRAPDEKMIRRRSVGLTRQSPEFPCARQAMKITRRRQDTATCNAAHSGW